MVSQLPPSGPAGKKEIAGGKDDAADHFEERNQQGQDGLARDVPDRSARPDRSQPRGYASIWTWPPSRQVILRVVAALALIVLAFFTNRSFLGWGLFVILAVLFIPIPRFRSFLISFIPYGAVWFIFTALRSLADETILARTVNLQVARFERWIFDGQIPTVTLQQHFYIPGQLQWWDYLLTFVHWSYFAVPHIVAWRLWHKYPQVFQRYLTAMTILLTIGLVIYFAIPSNPPWLSGETLNSPAAPTVYRVMEPVGERLGGGLYQAGYQVIGESNPIAAMPSIHMAITFLLIFPARRFGRVWRALAIAYALLMGCALVYLGEHYVVDVMVGSAIAAYGWWVSAPWLGAWRPLFEKRRHGAVGQTGRRRTVPAMTRVRPH